MASTPAESSPYSEFQAELSEIHRHKWLTSEREGRDIGFEQALTEWAAHHRQSWRQARNLKLKAEK